MYIWLDGRFVKYLLDDIGKLKFAGGK